MIALAAWLLGWWVSLAPPGYCVGFPPGVSVRQERICGMDLAWQQLASKLFAAALVVGFGCGLLFAWAWNIGRLWGGTLADAARAAYHRRRGRSSARRHRAAGGGVWTLPARLAPNAEGAQENRAALPKEAE